MMHLTPDQIDGYKRRTLTLDERHAISDHLAECAPCGSTLLATRSEGPVPAAGLLFAGETDAENGQEHLPYEDMEAYINGELKPASREIIEGHLEFCALCRATTETLRSVREALAALPAGEPAPRSLPYWKERLLTFRQMPRLRTALQLSGAALAGAAAMLLLGRVRVGATSGVKPTARSTDPALEQQLRQAQERVLRLRQQLQQLQQLAQQRQQDQTRLQAAQEARERAESSAAVARQQLALMAAERAAWKAKATRLAAAREPQPGQMLAGASGRTLIAVPVDPADSSPLQAHHLALPTERLALLGSRSALMGDHKEGLTLLRPDNTFVTTLRPTLAWKPIPRADRYEVRIIADQANETRVSQTLDAPQRPQAEIAWQVPATSPLAPATIYRWQVVATLEDGHQVYPALRHGARFGTLSAPELAEIDRKRSLYAQSPLLLGVLYARYGALDAAEQALDAQLKAHPDDVSAHRMLLQLRAARTDP